MAGLCSGAPRGNAPLGSHGRPSSTRGRLGTPSACGTMRQAPASPLRVLWPADCHPYAMPARRRGRYERVGERFHRSTRTARDRTGGGGRAMGRGRAKAKQTKVARQLKYGGPTTDLERLQAELAGSPTFEPEDSDEADERRRVRLDPYAKYADDRTDPTMGRRSRSVAEPRRAPRVRTLARVGHGPGRSRTAWRQRCSPTTRPSRRPALGRRVAEHPRAPAARTWPHTQAGNPPLGEPPDAASAASAATTATIPSPSLKVRSRSARVTPPSPAMQAEDRRRAPRGRGRSHRAGPRAAPARRSPRSRRR